MGAFFINSSEILTLAMLNNKAFYFNQKEMANAIGCRQPNISYVINNLIEKGIVENAKGFIIGRTNAQNTIDDFSYEDALHDVLDELKVPVIYDADFGHVAPQWTMINGAYAEFSYEDGSAELKQSFYR